MADLNSRFDSLTRPPTFRVADVVGLVGALIAIAIFVATQFALGERMNRTEDRLAQSQKEIREDIGKIRSDTADLRIKAAIAEERQNRPQH
jgi:demethoxyubiquinone hydroxylase (CLK1/Coq7/Cat5 family)